MESARTKRENAKTTASTAVGSKTRFASEAKTKTKEPLKATQAQTRKTPKNRPRHIPEYSDGSAVDEVGKGAVQQRRTKEGAS